MLQIQAVYYFRGYVTKTATQLFCLKMATYATYHISNIWTIIFNIKYPSLLTKEQPVLMAARDDSNKPSCNFSASQQKLVTPFFLLLRFISSTKI
jgi:hypothetical protein